MPKQIQIGSDGHRVDVQRTDAGRPFCGAKRRDSEPCTQVPILGMMRCRQHGGKTPKGPASPSYKTGAQSRWRKALGIPLPAHDDSSMLDVRNGVQIQEEVIARLGEQLASGDSPRFREVVQEQAQTIESMANAMADVALDISDDLADDLQLEALTAAASALVALCEKGMEDGRLISKLSDAAYKLSNQVEGAHRARTNAVNAVNLKDAQRFFSRVVVIVREEAGAKHAQRVLDRIDREVLGNSPAGVSGEGRVIDAPGPLAD